MRAASAASTWSIDRRPVVSTRCERSTASRNSRLRTFFDGTQPESATAVACGNTSIARPFTDPPPYRGNPARAASSNARNPTFIHA